MDLGELAIALDIEYKQKYKNTLAFAFYSQLMNVDGTELGRICAIKYVARLLKNVYNTDLYYTNVNTVELKLYTCPSTELLQYKLCGMCLVLF